MQNNNDTIIHVEHLNKIFQSIRGYWRQKKHPVQAVKGNYLEWWVRTGRGKRPRSKCFRPCSFPQGAKQQFTRGIQAARLAMDGATWLTIRPLFLGELFVGLIYASIGYLVFTWFEKLSLVDGQIETI